MLSRPKAVGRNFRFRHDAHKAKGSEAWRNLAVMVDMNADYECRDIIFIGLVICPGSRTGPKRLVQRCGTDKVEGSNLSWFRKR